jgi:hypothetical protein
MTDLWQTGLPGVDLVPGDHICAFYFGVDERDEIVVPFLRAGLHAGDKCLCVIDTGDPRMVLNKLGADDVDVEGFVQSTQLDVRAADKAYLRTGEFSVEGMIAFLTDYVMDATEGGYADTRITGEGAWALRGAPGAEKLAAYESELNRFVADHPHVVLCLYDLALFGGGMMVDLLRTHPKLLLGGLLLDNPNYLTPDEFLASRA